MGDDGSEVIPGLDSRSIMNVGHWGFENVAGSWITEQDNSSGPV